jgi:hypothetical protein
MLNIVVGRTFIIHLHPWRFSNAHISRKFSLFFPQINNLKPATSYVFLIRAENSYGLSEPSAVSSAIKTLANDKSGVLMPNELAAARKILSGKVSVRH